MIHARSDNESSTVFFSQPLEGPYSLLARLRKNIVAVDRARPELQRPNVSSIWRTFCIVYDSTHYESNTSGGLRSFPRRDSKVHDLCGSVDYGRMPNRRKRRVLSHVSPQRRAYHC